MSGDRCTARTIEAGEHCALGYGGGEALRMIDGTGKRQHGFIAGAALHAQRALTDGSKKFADRKRLRDRFGHLKTFKSGDREDGCVHLTSSQFVEASVDVAA